MAIKTDYLFLAHPPPPKRRPHQPLPAVPSLRPSLESAPAQAARRSRRGSGTFSAIAAWAAHVQPGSPASLSPRSPHRRHSLCRNRCPSITASLLHVAPTPTTPSLRDFKADLTTVGYTSVFLQLPNSPVSATIPLPIKPSSPDAAKSIPVPPIPSPTCKPRGFTRFRSLSVLRSHGRSKSVCPDSPTKMKAKTVAASAAIVKRKKAKYAMRPPPLVSELALMQFADGGSTDDNIKRVVEIQAKTAGIVGHADVHRDGKGGIWWDQDEEMEYAHLLSEGDESRLRASGDLRWVTFGSNTSPSAGIMPEEARRGSMSTQDSDLDPRHIVQPVDLLDGNELALFGSAIAPLATHKPTTYTQSRPHRDLKCQRKRDFSIDTAFSRPNVSLKSPRGKVRRRPAPLRLSPPGPQSKQPTNSPTDVEKVRKDFIETSFEPAVSVPVTPTMPATIVSLTTPVDARGRPIGNSWTMNTPWRTVNEGLMSLGMKTKPSMLNMIGLFKSARKEDIAC